MTSVRANDSDRWSQHSNRSASGNKPVPSSVERRSPKPVCLLAHLIPHTFTTNRSPSRLSFWRKRKACESSVRVVPTSLHEHPIPPKAISRKGIRSYRLRPMKCHSNGATMPPISPVYSATWTPPTTPPTTPPAAMPNPLT